MARRNALRDLYDEINFVKNYYKEHGKVIEKGSKMSEYITKKRREIRRINQYGFDDPLAQSMQEEWRHSFDENGDGGYDYCLMSDDGETEDEIRELAKSAVGYPPICSPYDCTGKRFTEWIDVHRVPAGFAVIHRWGLDV